MLEKRSAEPSVDGRLKRCMRNLVAKLLLLFLMERTTENSTEVRSYESRLVSSILMILSTTMTFISDLVEERRSTLGQLSNLVLVLRSLPPLDMNYTVSVEQH